MIVLDKLGKDNKYSRQPHITTWEDYCKLQKSHNPYVKYKASGFKNAMVKKSALNLNVDVDKHNKLVEKEKRAVVKIKNQVFNFKTVLRNGSN